MSTFDDERRMQVYMDKVYRRKSWRIDRACASKLFDCTLSKNGDNRSVEEKFLFCQNDYDQGLIEIVQDLRTADLGWFYHTKCDFLHWVYCPVDRTSPPRTLHIVKWSIAKDAIFKWMVETKWQRYNHCPENYGLTLNLPIKWAALDDVGALKTLHFDWRDGEVADVREAKPHA